MRKYRFGVLCFGVSRMRLNQLLAQEGQPCSYCIAVFMLNQKGEVLRKSDSLAYSRHLAKDHGVKTYWIED